MLTMKIMKLAGKRMEWATALALLAVVAGCATRPGLAPIPAVPPTQAPDSEPLGDLQSFPEMKLDLPVAPGPFEPTWESIEKNYPGEPAWLRDAKCGIRVHFGPQSAGEGGDWHACFPSNINLNDVAGRQ